MKRALFTIIVAISAGIMATVAFAPGAMAKPMYKFAGGPAGGIFQFMAGGIATYPGVKAIEDFRLLAAFSGGSVENLRKVNSGACAFGVVYSGHVYQGREGLMQNDATKYTEVLAVSYFYGAPAQLVVKKGSGINGVMDLVGKKVDVGNAGSGAFANCELFFTHMGVWDKIQRSTMGYNDAAVAFGNNQLDAFWLFVGYPSNSVIRAAQTNDIKLVNLYKDAEQSGFLKKYPYFSKRTIPAGTYRGVDVDIPSFQDSALWVANSTVPADVVYTLLAQIYSPEGLAHMVSVKKTARSMSIEGGITGIVTPLHPGAERFWKEKGILK